jgi:hypothetical protein
VIKVGKVVVRLTARLIVAASERYFVFRAIVWAAQQKVILKFLMRVPVFIAVSTVLIGAQCVTNLYRVARRIADGVGDYSVGDTVIYCAAFAVILAVIVK